MRFALCNEVIADRPFDQQCAFAAALGYDGLEIAPFTLGDDPRRLGDRDVAAARRALADAGIVATGLHWLLVAPDGLSITTADPTVRRTTREVMLCCVDLCAELGGEVLVHGSPRQRAVAPDDAGARGRALELFAAAAERAAERGVTYCLEALSPDETNFINTLAEAAALVDEVASPAFRTMIDTASAGRAEPKSVAETIRSWVPSGHIAHVQFNDRSRRAAGQGEDDFLPILRALKESGYDRIIAMEPFVYEPDRGACAAYTLGYIKGLWRSLA